MNGLFKKADAVCVVNPSNLFYFSGYHNADAAIVLTSDKKYYISDPRSLEEASQLLKGFEIVDCEGGSYLDAAVSIISKRAPETLGYEDQTIIYKDYLTLCKAPCKFVGISGAIEELRAVKSPEELKKIKAAQAITDEVFENVLGMIKEGMSEKEVASLLNSRIYSKGATLAFDTIVAFGENTSKPHAHPSDKKLKKGDPVTIDFGAKCEGYCSDMTRSFSFGKPPEDYKRIYNIVLEAQLNALSKLYAGISGSDGCELAKEVFRRYGLEEYFTHSLGHSLGIDIHESPRLSAKYHSPIPKGAVMSVEPGLYFPSKFGVRIEDIAVFENNGLDILTNSPKKLIII